MGLKMGLRAWVEQNPPEREERQERRHADKGSCWEMTACSTRPKSMQGAQPEVGLQASTQHHGSGKG